MARNDGVDRTSVRNLAVSDKAVGNTQQHNEREKDSYRNPDIIPQRAAWNVHFKKPTASYTDLFAQLEAAGTISTRGLLKIIFMFLSVSLCPCRIPGNHKDSHTDNLLSPESAQIW